MLGTGMTVEDVKRFIADEIDAKSPDDEEQHFNEDELYQAVLAAIADGAENAAELARATLETKKLPFARWCA